MKLLQNRIRQAEFDRVVWSVKPEVGTTLAEMLTPEYWTNVARSLKPGARIEVRPEDGSWFAELLVRSSGDKTARVALLSFHDFSEKTEEKLIESVYEAKFAGAAKWRVARKSDGEVMIDGLDKLGALSWIENNERE